jgi:hypothetical protein
VSPIWVYQFFGLARFCLEIPGSVDCTVKPRPAKGTDMKPFLVKDFRNGLLIIELQYIRSAFSLFKHSAALAIRHWPIFGDVA